MRSPSLLLIVLLATACSDDLPPRIISSSLLQNTPDAHGPYRIVAVILDERPLEGSSVHFTTDGTRLVDTATAASVAMTSEDGETWIAELPGLPLGTVVTWAVVARDARDQLAIDPAPLPGGHRFVVGNVPSKPEVLTLWPARGPNSGGTFVLMVGRDFREGITARFGGGKAETIVLHSRAQVRVQTPRGPVGFVDVFADNLDGGEGVKLLGFEYFPAPEIFEVIPNRGPTAGGTRVRIIGLRFAAGARFYFGEDQCTDLVIVSSTEATCLTPPHAEGWTDVSIEHDTLGMGTKPNAYYYVPPPEILMIVPARGPDLGGTRVQIIGRNFTPGARVLFDGEPASVQSVDSARIDAVTPPHPVGFADVAVINPDEQEDTLADGFFFFGPPEIHRIEPPYAAAEGGATVRIVGANFIEDTIVTLEGVELVCTFLSETEIECITPTAPPDSYDVTVTNPDLRNDTLADGLTYFQILAVTPSEGPELGGTPVRITGINLPPTSQIFFGGALADCNWISASRMDCATPPGPGDTFVDVDVLPPDQGQVPSTLVRGYYYIPAPDVLSVVPGSGPLRGGQTVTIVGRYFMSGATVTFDGAPCTNVVFVSSVELRCTVPPGSAGLAVVEVTNPDGQAGNNNSYEYVPITFTPAWGLVDGFANLEIMGAGFAANAAVTIGGQPALDVVFISATHIRARAPAAANTGPANIIVDNPADPAEISPTPFSYRVYRDRSTFDMAGSGETSEVMILDLDGDGENDLVYANGTAGDPGEDQVLENLGSGQDWQATFIGAIDVSNEGNHCDFDEDGDEDLVWGTSGGPIHLFRNNGNFSFNTISLPGGPSDSFEASFHDVTGDGLCDLINFAIGEEDTVLENDSGSFSVIADSLPTDAGFIHDHKIDSGDFDGDGDNDLVAVVDDVNFVSDSQRHRIYLNDGSGVFTEDMRNFELMTSIHGDIYDVRVGDLDRDGDPDVVMPSFQQVPIILINDGTGVFTLDTSRMPNEAIGASALVLTDIEGDFDLDVYLVDLDGPANGTSALFLNDGTGVFFRAVVGEPQNPPAANRAAAGDLNGDGAADIVQGVVNGSNRMDWAEE